jgi:linoleoyl-CoA desaturase
LGYGVASLVVGFVLAIVFQLAHIVEDLNFINPDNIKSVNVEDDWAVHQMNTTANFATNSKVLSWLLGGLNFQVEHHLFPRISHVHYPQLNEILIRTCDDFGVKYKEYPSMFSAIKSHVLHLRQIGKAS